MNPWTDGRRHQDDKRAQVRWAEMRLRTQAQQRHSPQTPVLLGHRPCPPKLRGLRAGRKADSRKEWIQKTHSIQEKGKGKA